MKLLENCLTEEELWATQEGAIDVVRKEHLLHCKECREKYEELRKSRQEIRRLYAESSRFNTITETRRATNSQTLQNVPEILNERYQIIQRVDQGGQGVVYLGIDLHLRRQVAIKLSHTTFVDDADSSERILSEGQMLAKINHPLLAQVFDIGIHSGRPYLVMEFVKGASLQTVLRSKRLSSGQIVRLISLIAQGVAAIHECGILHLDLKPGNIILTQDGSCKIVDLGTSWLESNQTHCYLGGTAGYMAPEQAAGKTDSIGPWTDVYGLGTILAAMLLSLSEATTSENELMFDTQKARKDRSIKNINLPNSLLGTLCIDATRACHHERINTIQTFQKRLARFGRYRQYSVAIHLCAFLSLISYPLTLNSFDITNPTADLPQSRVPAEKRIEGSHRRGSIIQRDAPIFEQVAVYGLLERDYYFCAIDSNARTRFFPSKWVKHDGGTEFLAIASQPQGLEQNRETRMLCLLLIPGKFPEENPTVPMSKLTDSALASCDIRQINDDDRLQLFLIKKPSLNEGHCNVAKLSHLSSQEKLRVHWHSFIASHLQVH